MIPFVKVEVSAGEHDIPKPALHIESQGYAIESLQVKGNPVWDFTLKCVHAVDAVFDTLSDAEKDELRAELRKYLKSIESKEVTEG